MAVFPPSVRVRTGREYARVFDAAKRNSHPLLAVHWLRGQAQARLGLAVSRKVDTRAVGRNRIKRVLRDTFRHLRAQLAPGDYVVVARSAAAKAENAVLRDAFVQTLRRAGALPPSAVDGTMPPASPVLPPATVSIPRMPDVSAG